MLAIAFEELPGFTKEVTRLLDDDSYAKLQAELSKAPGSGKLIKAGHGLRKLRWALPGRGKSGGVRVIYYWWTAPGSITLCEIYPKNEKENLSPATLQALRKTIELIRRARRWR